jgi:hypothetical protein
MTKWLLPSTCWEVSLAFASPRGCRCVHMKYSQTIHPGADTYNIPQLAPNNPRLHRPLNWLAAETCHHHHHPFLFSFSTSLPNPIQCQNSTRFRLWAWEIVDIRLDLDDGLGAQDTVFGEAAAGKADGQTTVPCQLSAVTIAHPPHHLLTRLGGFG